MNNSEYGHSDYDYDEYDYGNDRARDEQRRYEDDLILNDILCDYGYGYYDHSVDDPNGCYED